mgnify:CR=1 FL=1
MLGSQWRGLVSLYFSWDYEYLKRLRDADPGRAQYSVDTRSHPVEVDFAELAALLEPSPSICTVETCIGQNCPEKRREERPPGLLPWPQPREYDASSWSPGHVPAGERRSNANVRGFSCLVFDVDHGIGLAELPLLRERLAAFAYLLQSTHNHHPPSNCRFRVVFPLSRVATCEEWGPLLRAVSLKYGLMADDKTFSLSNHFYLSRTKIGIEPIAEVHDGEVMDVDAELASAKVIPIASRGLRFPTSTLTAPPASTEPVDMVELRKCLVHYQPKKDPDGQKKAVLRRVVAGEAFAFKGSRGFFSAWLGTILAWAFPAGTSVNAAMELIRPSLAAAVLPEDNTPDNTPEAWLSRARFQFETAATLRYTQHLEWEKTKKSNEALAIKAREVLGLKPPRTVPTPIIPSLEAVGSAAPETTEDEPETPATLTRMKVADDAFRKAFGWEPFVAKSYDELWMSLLLLNEESGKLLQDEANAETILAFDPEWREAFRLNLVLNRIEVRPGVPISDVSRLSPNILPTAVRNWLAGKPHQLRLPHGLVKAQIAKIARENAFDPLNDYLNAPEWDGESRCYTFFERYCNAKCTDEHGRDITDFVRKVSVRWLIGAAARGLNPGCKMDTVLVLEGLTGVKKTTFFEVLAGEWYGLMTQQIADKDAQMQSVRRWIVELGELSSLSHTKLDQLKAHLSLRIDSFRPPYGDAVEDFPRRCVYVGSTEREQYLHDDMGNRRFWPIRVGEIDIEALKRDRDQIWAEAVVRYRAHEQWWFDQEDNAELERVTIQRLDAGTYGESIMNWWQNIDPSVRPATIGLVQVATEALKIPEDRINKQAIGRALKNLGFVRGHLDLGGYRRPVYFPSEMLRTIQKRSAIAHHLGMVPSIPVPVPVPVKKTDETLN